MHPLETISPIDGRYHEDVKELASFFSEMALMRYRLLVEVEYLIALSHQPGIPQVPLFNPDQTTRLRAMYTRFNLSHAEEIKQIEKTTNHDVKAIEYFLREKMKGSDLEQYIPFIHFALTSEDVNNLTYSLILRDALHNVYLPLLTHVTKNLQKTADTHSHLPMLALTHGQSATPTTLGKELHVFVFRLMRQICIFDKHTLLGKLNGATGTWAAHIVAYPDVDWIEFSNGFITSLGLEPNIITTQIEPHDSLAECFHIISRINTILTDFCRDMWSYISRGIIVQKPKEDEVGSSTMPHKINPIQFENAEGNLGIANAYFEHLAAKLPVSRMQRDLTDSTVLRNIGVPLAHSLLAYKNILKGLDRIHPNAEKLKQELNDHPEVLAEAIQTMLRKHGQADAYEQLKEATRGKAMTLAGLREFIASSNLPHEDKERLMRLEPAAYIGLAEEVAKKGLRPHS